MGNKMNRCVDFIQDLGCDISTRILMHLDPSDLVRICLVSKFWRNFVITNGVCKQLCLKMFPEISSNCHDFEVNNMIEPLTAGKREKWDFLSRNHKVYAFLAQSLSPSMRRDCLLEPVGACNTVFYSQKIICSLEISKGSSDPTVPEKLVYKLLSDICLVTEIHVQAFQDCLQIDCPVYSSRAVRFRMGHPKFPLQLERGYPDMSADGVKWADDNVMWTYTSPEFAMAHDSCLQEFKLPVPALCIGGFLQVELLGRVQKQKKDGLYYIRISEVEVVGRPLSSKFDIEMLDSSGKCSLKYYPAASGRTSAGALKRSGDVISKKVMNWMWSGLNPEDSDDEE